MVPVQPPLASAMLVPPLPTHRPERTFYTPSNPGNSIYDTFRDSVFPYTGFPSVLIQPSPPAAVYSRPYSAYYAPLQAGQGAVPAGMVPTAAAAGSTSVPPGVIAPAERVGNFLDFLFPWTPER